MWERLPGAEDREPEAIAGPHHELVGEPARLLGSGCDHDLVGREGRQCIRDRQQWIGIADASFGVNSPLFQPVDDCGGARSPARRRAASSSDSQRRSREFDAGTTTRISASDTSAGIAVSRATMSRFMGFPFAE